MDPYEDQPSEAALEACRQEMNTTAGGFPPVKTPSGSTATVTATDWTAEVATSGVPPFGLAT
jgi:hypothetical protein